MLLCVFSQKTLPYRVRGLDSNDALFSGSAEYVLELQGLLDVCVGDLKAQWEGLENRSVKCRCALILLDRVVSRLHLTAQVCEMCVTLLQYMQSDSVALKGLCCLRHSVLLKVNTLAQSHVGEGADDDVAELLSSISNLAMLQMRQIV